MAMIKCAECGTAISNTARTCPHCGARNHQAPMGGGAKAVLYILGGIVVLFLIFIGIGAHEASTPGGQERAQARAAIDACWQQQKNPALDPSTQRFVASTCQKMEADFRAHWNRDP